MYRRIAEAFLGGISGIRCLVGIYHRRRSLPLLGSMEMEDVEIMHLHF